MELDRVSFAGSDRNDVAEVSDPLRSVKASVRHAGRIQHLIMALAAAEVESIRQPDVAFGVDRDRSGGQELPGGEDR